MYGKVAAMSLGPTLPTLALQQVGSYLRHNGHEANVVARAALVASGEQERRMVM
jgi:hypothetical protein